MATSFRLLAVLTVIAAMGGTVAIAEEKSADEAAKRVKVKLEGITVLVPADWERGKPSNRLRLAQFQIPLAEGDTQPTELVVYHFGGAGGGVAPNIRRWINQFSGPGRASKVVKGTSPLGTYYLVDISGTYNMPVGPPIRRQTEELPNARMLAIILQVKDHGNYFFKLAGPDKSVSAQREALRASIQGDKKSEKAFELP